MNGYSQTKWQVCHLGSASNDPVLVIDLSERKSQVVLSAGSLSMAQSMFMSSEH